MTDRVSDERLADKLDALAAHFEAVSGDAYAIEENAADAAMLRQAARSLRSAREAEPVAVEALVYDWEYTDPKSGHWSYARTPERAQHLKSQGVKLTPVYTIDVVRKLQSDLHPSPSTEGFGVRLESLERYEQFVDGWGDEALGLKQHPKGDYVKFEDVAALLSALSTSAEQGITDEMVELGARVLCQRFSSSLEWDDLLYYIKNEKEPIRRMVAEQTRDRALRESRETLTAALSPSPKKEG